MIKVAGCRVPLRGRGMVRLGVSGSVRFWVRLWAKNIVWGRVKAAFRAMIRVWTRVKVSVGSGSGSAIGLCCLQQLQRNLEELPVVTRWGLGRRFHLGQDH